MINSTSVFISYAREDKDSATKLYSALQDVGVDAWLDEKNLLPGQNWESEIENAIFNTEYVITILSNHSVNKRGYVQKELRTAFEIFEQCPENSIFLIPVRIEDCIVPRKFLSEKIHYVDLFPSWEDGLKKIIDAIYSKYDAQKLIDTNPFSFSLWPKPIINDIGDIDTIIAIGHSQKGASPTNEDIKEIGDMSKYIDMKDINRPQSLGPAEYIPYLLRFLHNHSINKKITSQNKDIEIAAIDCYTDWHLLKFFKDKIRDKNIISLGAGDTNLISRWILSYYEKYLPVKFDSPFASQTIFCDEVENSEMLVLDQVEYDLQKNSGVLYILPNPLNHKKAVIIAAGLTSFGTQAAILALSDYSEKLNSKNMYKGNFIRVIKGIGDYWRPIDVEIVR